MNPFYLDFYVEKESIMEKPKKMDIIFVNPFFFEKDSYSIGVLNLVSILDKVDITNSIVDFNYAFGKEKLEMNIDERKNPGKMDSNTNLEHSVSLYWQPPKQMGNKSHLSHSEEIFI